MPSRASRPRSRSRNHLIAATTLAVGAIVSTYAGSLRWTTYARAIGPASLCAQGATLVGDDAQLQAAIGAATDGAVICVTADITLSQTLTITDTTVTLEGSSPEVTLDGGNGRRILYASLQNAQSQDTVTMRNLTLTGGNSTGASFFGNGGAILMRGQGASKDDAFVAMGITVTNSTSTGFGGAIASLDMDSVGIYDSEFTQVSATSEGGAIYSLGSNVLYVDGVTINRATAGASGGGIYSRNDRQVDIFRTTITNSSAGGSGGALAVEDDFTAQVDVTIYQSSFQNNIAAASGGAMQVQDVRSLILSQSTFTANTAGAVGGSVAVFSNDDQGEQVTALLNLSFADDVAAGDGGSVYAWVEGPTYLHNITATNTRSDEDGGFARIRSDSQNVAPAIVSVLDVDITGSRAQHPTDGDGGALVFRDLHTVFLRSSTIATTSATDDGGAVLIQDVQNVEVDFLEVSGTQAGDVGSFSAIGVSDTIAIRDSVFFDNASGDDGAGLNLRVINAGAIDIVNTTVTGNSQTDVTATTEGVVSLNGDPGSTASLDFVTISGNSGRLGGGVFTDGDIAVTATNSIIASNAAAIGTVDVYQRANSSFSPSYSLFSSPTSAVGTTLSGTGTLFGAPRLNALADNGGPTFTMLPQWNSPAVGSGDPNWSAPPANDQRGIGFPRDAGGRVSMGAIQGNSPAPPPVFPPSAPREVQAIAGDAQVTVTWTAPPSPGSFPITHYQVADARGGLSTLVTPEPGEPLSTVMTSLRNGQEYAFRVRALNGAGWGAWSEFSAAVTPRAIATIVITGSRDGSVVRVSGSATGLEGTMLTPRIRFPGPRPYADGQARPKVDTQGYFDWQRRTNKKTYVYFFAEEGELRSNRVVIRSRD